MTSAVGDAAALTDLLAEHDGWHTENLADLCECGFPICHASHPTEFTQEHHRAHVAEVLAGYVTTARAQALIEAAYDAAESHYLLIRVGDDPGNEFTPETYLLDRANRLYRTTENTE